MGYGWHPGRTPPREVGRILICDECDSEGAVVEYDDHDEVKICGNCLGIGYVNQDGDPVRIDGSVIDREDEYTVRKNDIINKKMTIETNISHDVEFYAKKGLSKKEALDKIQKEFDNEKRKLLKLEDRVLYEQIIKEKIRAHAAEKKHGPDVKLKDLIMSKERKLDIEELEKNSIFDNLKTKVFKCDVCNDNEWVIEDGEVMVCSDCIFRDLDELYDDK